MLNATQIKEQVTTRMIASLEKGVKPWAPRWHMCPNGGLPTSFSSRKPYRGINRLLLGLTAEEKGYSARWWGTFEQWKSHGGSVKKGEKSTQVILFKPITKHKENEQGEKEIDQFLVMRFFNVFNIEQVQGGDLDKWRDMSVDQGDPEDALEYAQEVVDKTGAKIRHQGDRAYYNPREDQITMPVKERFHTVPDYYATVFHELMHWAEGRIGERKADREYSFMELYAEIGACLLTESTGVPMGDRWENHVSYIDAWMKQMKADSSYVFKAASLADRGAQHILSYACPATQEADTLAASA